MTNTNSLDLELSSSQYASIADASQTNLDITAALTIEAWIKLEQLPSTAGTEFTIASKYELNGQRAYVLAIGTDDKAFLQWNSDGTSGTSTFVVTSSAIVVSGDVGNWVHVAASLTAATKTVVIYKNASSVSVAAVSGASTSIANTTAPFVVGSRPSSGVYGSFFDGLIDEVRVWAAVRTPTEITNNYNIELVGNESNLRAYYKFSNNYLDETANNNDLTASGSPVFSTSVPFDPSIPSSFFLMF